MMRPLDPWVDTIQRIEPMAHEIGRSLSQPHESLGAFLLAVRQAYGPSGWNVKSYAIAPEGGGFHQPTRTLAMEEERGWLPLAEWSKGSRTEEARSALYVFLHELAHSRSPALPDACNSYSQAAFELEEGLADFYALAIGKSAGLDRASPRYIPELLQVASLLQEQGPAGLHFIWEANSARERVRRSGLPLSEECIPAPTPDIETLGLIIVGTASDPPRISADNRLLRPSLSRRSGR